MVLMVPNPVGDPALHTTISSSFPKCLEGLEFGLALSLAEKSKRGNGQGSAHSPVLEYCLPSTDLSSEGPGLMIYPFSRVQQDKGEGRITPLSAQ